MSYRRALGQSEGTLPSDPRRGYTWSGLIAEGEVGDPTTQAALERTAESIADWPWVYRLMGYLRYGMSMSDDRAAAATIRDLAASGKLEAPPASPATSPLDCFSDLPRCLGLDKFIPWLLLGGVALGGILLLGVVGRGR